MSVSNVIDLHHNTEIEGLGVPAPPQTFMGKPDVSLNKIKLMFPCLSVSVLFESLIEIKN